jgi:kynureninase
MSRDAQWQVARDLDENDPFGSFRNRFHHPEGADGSPKRYFCGNSLGLQPRSASALMKQELDDWARLAVDAHFDAVNPWFSYHEIFREGMAAIVGAKEREVVVMNSLTANLHLMMISFFRPDKHRRKILVEDATFPSDRYAVTSQLQLHGLDPDECMIVARPREGEAILRTEDLEAILAEQGDEIALVMMSGVQYFTGQFFDLRRITAAAHKEGCRVGFDLAHAAGNVVLQLHDWDVDFAVWCTYKYLNAGPGAVGGCFVHERHSSGDDLPRLAGWWGNDPETRFGMHLIPDFHPAPGADGWQLSNPPVLALAPLKASLDLFAEAGGVPALRKKSLRLTRILEERILDSGNSDLKILTPSDPAARGAQLSVQITGHPEEMFRMMLEKGMVVDFRKPDVIRIAPTPLYNSFQDVQALADLFAR